METAITFCVGNKLVAFFVILPTIVNILLLVLVKVVVIHKVIACVIRRVDIYHLHFAQIVLAEQFQHLQVVALYIEVLRIVKVHTLITTRTQGIGRRGICQTDGITFVRPSKLISFFRSFHYILRQFLPELVEVNRHLRFSLIIEAFSQTIGKQLPNLLYILIHDIRGLH